MAFAGRHRGRRGQRHGGVHEKQPIAALTRLYPNYTQVIARTDAGINSRSLDMRGKRVSTGAPNSGTEVIANRMLEAADLTRRKTSRPSAPNWARPSRG